MNKTSESDRFSEAIPEPHAEEIITSLMARAYAAADLAAATVRLAVAEAHLALSSALYIAALVALLLVMVLVTWLVGLATAFAALQALGMSALWALMTLLFVQLAICTLLAIMLFRLSRNLTFPLTRQALRPSAESV